MPYTPNVPQANQTIASTTSPIRGNFQFINTDLQVEHSFNGNAAGVAEGVHLQASMPNQVDPAALPTGTNGIYYVSGGRPKFYNLSNGARFIQTASVLQQIKTGTLALSKGTPIAITLSTNTVGAYYLMPPNTIDPSNFSAMGQYVSTATQLQIGAVSDPGIDVTNPSTTQIAFEPNTNSGNGTYTYFVVFQAP